ncbi:MAG: hypothetical protein WCI79_03370 [Candidatus Saccharibacteria bacterium]
MKQQKQSGFAHLAIIIVLVVALFGALGFVYWQNFMQPAKEVAPAAIIEKTTSVPAATTNKFTVDTVALAAPKSWTEIEKEATDIPVNENFIDKKMFIPGEKLEVVYGNGKKYFYIDVSVYGNSRGVSAKDWLVYDSGYGWKAGGGKAEASTFDEESLAKINGQDAYFRKEKVKRGESKTFDEQLNYVISANNKIVYIYAWTYAQSELYNDIYPSGIADFRKFEPYIAELAQSVIINK